MAQSGFTPIILFNSTTAGNTPTTGNLAVGELAINAADGKLYYNTGSAIKVLAGAGGAGIAGGSNTQVQYNSSGSLAGSANLTFDGTNLGLAGGTANGVAYLNGSKVLTTGSALTFDGSAFSNVQSGGTAALAFNSLSFTRNGANYVYATQNSMNYGGTQHIFLDNTLATEYMRLTSTGLGIGTSSPAVKLDVAGAIRSIVSGGTPVVYLNNGSTQHSIQNESNAFTFYNSGVKQMTLDTSGNLGLGVTPSAFTAGKALEVAYAGNAMWGTGAGDFSMLANVKYNGALQYANTGVGANRFNVAGGAYYWYTAPSGTAGNAISFTQAMTLDASGRLIIGNTSPSVGYQLTLGNTSNTASDISGIVLQEPGAASQLSYFKTTSQASSDTRTIIGNNTAARALAFETGGTERARIDSSGNLLIGTTSSTTAPASGVQLNNGSSIGTVAVGHANGTATGNYYASFAYNSSIIGSITQSGTTAVLYNLTSDQRLKTNISDAESASSLIDAIQVRQYDWKSDGSHQRYGFVAQELVNVAPEAVHQPTDPEEMMAVDYSKLVPMLVKEIQSLRARLKAANI